MNDLKGITQQGIESGDLPIYMGFAYIPPSIDRTEFISKCIANQTVWIITPYNQIKKDVLVSKSCIQQINFPLNSKDKGSPVAIINEPINNRPFVIGVFNFNDEIPDFQNENTFIQRKVNGDRFVAIEGNGNTGEFNISTDSTGSQGTENNINCYNKEDKAKLNVFVQGDIKLEANKTFQINANKKISFQIKDLSKDKNKVTNISYEYGVGFTYSDEFGNEIAIKDGEIDIKSDKFVFNDGSYAAVRGDKEETLWNSVLEALEALTVPTPLGPSGVPINLASFLKAKETVSGIKSTEFFLD